MTDSPPIDHVAVNSQLLQLERIQGEARPICLVTTMDLDLIQRTLTYVLDCLLAHEYMATDVGISTVQILNLYSFSTCDSLAIQRDFRSICWEHRYKVPTLGH